MSNNTTHPTDEALANIVRPLYDSTNELTNDEQLQLVLTCCCITDLFQPVVNAGMELKPVEDAFEYYEALFSHLEGRLQRAMPFWGWPLGGWPLAYAAIIDEVSSMSKADKLAWTWASGFVPDGDKAWCRIVCNSFDF